MGGCGGEEGMCSVQLGLSLGRGGRNELYMVQDGFLACSSAVSLFCLCWFE